MAHPRHGKPNERAVTSPLAARIGCWREQVTRELLAMAGEGLIEKVAAHSFSCDRKSKKSGSMKRVERGADGHRINLDKSALCVHLIGPTTVVYGTDATPPV